MVNTTSALVRRPPTTIPARHGADLAKARRIGSRLRLLIRGNPDPTPAQWRRLGEGLLEGDPRADALYAWMLDVGMLTARPLFERALAEGIESVPGAPEALHEFFAHVEHRPAWVDAARLEAGARACGISGNAGMDVLHDLALMGGYQASAINRTLVLTGALRDGAQRRIEETVRWWLDVTEPGGIGRGGAGFKSTIRVRLMHAIVRHHVQLKPEWNRDALGLPINQTDMAVTNLSFCVVFLFGQRLMGVPITKREGEDIMHLWKYIGWLMGVDEHWLVDTEQEGRIALYQHILAQAPPDESSHALALALMDEPTRRHYPSLPRLQARLQRARHLSIQSAYLGRATMKALGLPTNVIPWYPLVATPLNALWHLAHRLVPGGRDRLARRGRSLQVQAVKATTRVISSNDREANAEHVPTQSKTS